MVGAKMVGSVGNVKRGTTAGGETETDWVRVLLVAQNRVTTVERRAVGTWWRG